jgi:hypothetical protein
MCSSTTPRVSGLPSSQKSGAPPEIIAGTLAYLAPKQTGRKSRSIDTNDLYSSVVIFTNQDPPRVVRRYPIYAIGGEGGTSCVDTVTLETPLVTPRQA